MRVLVAYGSKYGGTEGIAKTLGDALRHEGLEVDVVPADQARAPELYDGVVVGGGLYANRWHRHARRFIMRHADALREMPVWLFSSGPLGEEANRGDVAPTAQIRSLMARVNARQHVTFGGRLEKDARGYVAQAMAKTMAGDWRDMDQARAWGQQIGREILASPRRVPVRSRHAARLRRVLVGLCLFAGLTAIAGGLVLVAAPDGSLVQLPLSVLEHSPFENFLLPGLLLFGIVGLGNTTAAVLLLRLHPLANRAAFLSGGALTIWIVVEMLMLRTIHWLQVSYLALGLAIQVLALLRERGMRRAGPTRRSEADYPLPPGGPVPHRP